MQSGSKSGCWLEGNWGPLEAGVRELIGTLTYPAHLKAAIISIITSMKRSGELMGRGFWMPIDINAPHPTPLNPWSS